MKRLLLTIAVFLLSSCAVTKHNPVNVTHEEPSIVNVPSVKHDNTVDFNQAFKKSNGTPAEKIEFINLVLTHLDQANPTMMFFAARNALANDQLENAGFLYFAARAREGVDFYRFPNRKANDTLLAVNKKLGDSINAEIIRHPDIYDKILLRLETWEILPIDDYDPGWQWDKSQTKPKADVEAAARKLKIQMLKRMHQSSELIHNPDYFKAMIIVQNYNLPLDDKAKNNPDKKQEYQKALETLKKIEEKKGYSLLVK